MGGQSDTQLFSDVLNPLGSIEKNRAANEEVEALKRREIEGDLAATQQKEQRANQLEKVVSAATAEQSARGLSLGSGSFKAIQSDSFNDFARDERITDMNTKFRDDAINDQVSNINQVNKFENYTTIFATGVQAAGAYFGIKSGGKKAGGKKSPISGKANNSGYDTDSSANLQKAFDQSSDSDFPDAFSYTPEQEENF